MAQAHNWMMASRSIGSAMIQYSKDHAGNYPDGKSSTEVFQKLLDGKYVDDPTLFYIGLTGKTKPVAGQLLKPENVSWDVTVSINSETSDDIPLVFMTGYRVNYVPGGAAISLVKPYPDFGDSPRTWVQWWHGDPKPLRRPMPGIAVCYKNFEGEYKFHTNDPEGSFSNFIPPTFNPKGRSYHQLTPSGLMP